MKQDQIREHNKRVKSEETWYEKLDSVFKPLSSLLNNPTGKVLYDYSLQPVVSAVKQTRPKSENKAPPVLDQSQSEMSRTNGSKRQKKKKNQNKNGKNGNNQEKKARAGTVNNNPVPMDNPSNYNPTLATVLASNVDNRNTLLAAPAAVGFRTEQTLNMRQSVIISGSEYYADVNSTGTGFTAFGIEINPGLASTFPWLSTVASAYEYYTMLDFCIELKPSSSSTNVGTVMLTYDWDMYDPLPTSKRTLMTYKPIISGSPWTYQCLEAPRNMLKAHNNGKLLVRSGAYQGDENLNDVCLAILGLQGVPAGYVGDIWLHYKVKLFGQQSIPEPTCWRLQGPDNGTLNPLDGSPTIIAGSVPWITIGSGTTLFFQCSGVYFIEWRQTNGDTISAMSMTLSGTGNAANVRNGFLVNTLATEAQVDYELNISTFSPPAPVVLTFAITCVSTGICSIRIMPYNSVLN